MGRKIAIFMILVAIVIGLYKCGFLTKRPEPIEYGDGWWGAGDKPSVEDTTIRKFELHVDDAVLLDLKSRLNRTRFFEPLENSNFHYGFNPTYMKTVLEYWMNKYDWRKQEEILNGFDQFKTNIEGIDVHYVHVKAKGVEAGKVKPIVMVHGWPGSFTEFYKIIPMLTDPLNHGGTEDDAFEVVIPSIPGFGLSEAPHKPGLDLYDTARIFDKLMTRLGHDNYYYQGGDWGSVIGVALTYIRPSLAGYHTNMPFGQPPLGPLKWVISNIFPSLYFDDDDKDHLYPVSKYIRHRYEEAAYLNIHSTKPDTPGFAFNDSPIGLAAYIMEKFVAWTNPAHMDLEDGGLLSYYTMDELLNNVMVYWINGNVASCLRFYKESIPRTMAQPMNRQSRVPTGIASFKHEVGHLPESWAKEIYLDLVSYTRMPRGGHFPALEVPELLADDIRLFNRRIVTRKMNPVK
ncbi:epoxide hydrolase 1-like [Glandiceps talaboti]